MLRPQQPIGASRHLDDDQLRSFDQEYVTPEMWDTISRQIKDQFQDGPFSFLDVGGGNGVFADRLLDRFPKSTGLVIDNADVLLRVNTTHSRKTVIGKSAQEFFGSNPTQRFDLICFNWLLHHLVRDSYYMTRKLQLLLLRMTTPFLTTRGRISVLENLYDGLFLKDLPSKLIYGLTASQGLAPIIRKLGANTAGCGVCFLSSTSWVETFQAAGLDIEDSQVFEKWKLSILRRVCLQISSVRVGHYWLRPRTAPPMYPK